MGLAPSAQAQKAASGRSRAEEVLASMPRVANVGQVAISGDGSTLAWIQKGSIHLRSVRGDDREQTIAPPDELSLRDIAWSHDGKQLAYVAEEKGSTPAAELWVAQVPAGTPKKLASLKGYVSTPRFSPDDTKLAFLYIANMPRIAGPLVPMTPPEGVIEEKFYEQRINTVDLASGAVRPVSPDDVYVYEYDWAPDGKTWAATAAHGSGDNNWWIARLYTIDSQSGELHEVLKPKLQIAAPRYSPDGKNIAFISGIMSDEGSTGGDVHIVPANGGTDRDLTPAMKASATGLNWVTADKIVFTENVDGDAGVATVSTKGGGETTLWSGFESISAGRGTPISLANDGHTSAVVRQSFSTPPEIWAGPIGEWKRITSLNENVKPAWGEARNVHWTSTGGKSGPAAACMPRFDTGNGAASALGYFVLCPNPRGSYGQGEAFTQGNVKDFGYGDFHDIMAGITSLAREYPIDLNRLGIHGHSYGGYMTMWAETQTNKFKAAVAGAGLSDWLSYYGENDIDEWMIPYFGASVYKDPQVYARSSPISFVNRVTTPTLILVGDRDGEVPAPQSFEWWHALKTLDVPVELVVYANEGHAISRPADRHDYQLRTLEWFEKYIGSSTPHKTEAAGQ